MRYAICSLTIFVCLAATAGIAYLHGHERALGREEWHFESRLVNAYASEIPIHAGPLGILVVAALIGVRRLGSQRVVLVAAGLTAALALYETRESERAYILTTPGQLVSSPGFCTTIVIVLWVVSLGVLAGVAYGAFRAPKT